MTYTPAFPILAIVLLAASAVNTTAATAATGVAATASRAVSERRPADPRGTVEIANTAGRVSVTGWDRPEVEVTGTLGERVERLEFTSSGGRTVVRVVLLKGSHRSGSGDAVLDIKIPGSSRLNASTVSADLVVRGVLGEQRLATVSGDVEADLGREASARSISGDLRLGSRSGTTRLEVNSVSGTIRVEGQVGGRVEAATVSGDASFVLGSVTEAEFETVSGNLTASLALAPDGRLEAGSVSGNVRFDFVGALPPARFELQSFSGDIELCPAARTSIADEGGLKLDASSRKLEFRNAAGTARVEVETMSGDVRLCTRKAVP
jgi:hypothetical protein